MEDTHKRGSVRTDKNLKIEDVSNSYVYNTLFKSLYYALFLFMRKSNKFAIVTIWPIVLTNGAFL